MSLPNKPWSDGDTFTNDETGVKYTFDGEKWLAGGGAEADDATLALINEVDRTAIMRDDALKKEHDEDSTKQSVINAGVVVRLDELFWRDVEIDQLTRDGDKALQEQIDTNKDASESGDRHLQSEIDQIALALETLLVQREHGKWKYVGFSGDTIPRNAGEFALISDDLSANDNIITLNQEDLKGITHGFGDVEIGDYVEIVDLDEPLNYVLFVVTKAPEGTGIVNVEVKLKDKGQNILIGETCEVRFFAVSEQDINLTELDNRYLKLSGGTMTGPAVLKVNHLEPVNTPMIQYNGDPNSTHAAGLINRFMMTEYVKSELASNSGGPLPKFKMMTINEIDEWDIGIPSNAGDLAFLNTGNIGTLSLSLTRSIVFAGRALDGGRYARDKDAKDFKRAFGTNFSVLDESGEKTIMSMSGSHNALCEVGYLGSYEGVFYDMYQITWQSPSSTSINSDIEMWEAGKTYRLHIPELFY